MKQKKIKSLSEKRNDSIVGKNLSFEAQEAYNLLRINILLSFSDEKQCRIIGITSALRGDGKSTSAINIAYTFANAGKRVLLVECDLRLPTICANLKLARGVGLSNYLAGQCPKEAIVRKTDFNPNVDIITSGSIPPNPSELLGSQKMKELLAYQSENYDFVILDLTPMIAVSDALIMSPLVDGMVVVVRQNSTDCGALRKTIKQFEFAEVKILGFILNDHIDATSGYYKRYDKNYKKYYRETQGQRQNRMR